MGKSYKYSVPHQNTHIHELLMILLLYIRISMHLDFIINYCTMYVESPTYHLTATVLFCGHLPIILPYTIIHLYNIYMCSVSYCPWGVINAEKECWAK